jgi:hypothetical protein
MSNTIQMPKPRTEAQRAAARANGAKSQGPITEEGKAKSALNSLRHGLLARALVLRSESEPKFLAILNGYLDEYQPEGQTENRLIEEIAAAQWHQERCWTLTTALIDITMDRMEQEIAAEFREIDNATRTALAFVQQADQSGGLVLLHRYAARHSREWHLAIDKLRKIQKERREQSDPPTGHRPLATDNCSLPNEPDPNLTPAPSTPSDSQLATDHRPLATEPATRHSPLATKPATEPADSQLATEPATSHWPLATAPCYPKVSST